MSFKKNSLTQKRLKSRHRHRGSLFPWWLPVVVFFFWLGYHQLQIYWTPAEAIFVLGGDETRERFAAQLAQQHPDLPIWISSGSPQSYAQKIFANAGIDNSRLHLDYRAVDTLTNFTTLVDEFETQGVKSVYLITSDSHMRRARLIGEIVLGSHGIILKPLSVPSTHPQESIGKCLRDGARAILWLTTGRTGVSLLRYR